MKTKIFKNVLFVLGVFLLFPLILMGQSRTYNFEFPGTPLEFALTEIARESGINLVFDPALTNNRLVYQRIRNADLNTTLLQTLAGTGLDWIILSTGTYVIIKTSYIKPHLGSFSGMIIDNRTGEPLPGATVLLADAGGGTVSNQSGRFNLSGLINGHHRIIVSFVGYEPVVLDIHIPNGENASEVIRLNQGYIQFSPIVVGSTRPMLAYNLQESETKVLSSWIAQRGNSPIQTLSLFSGVQKGRSFNDIHIQGSNRTEHRLFLDGVPLYAPSNNLFLNDIFSPFAISRISVDRAGFEADKGSFISGKVNLSHAMASENSGFGLAQADASQANLRAKLSTKIGDGRRFHIMSAVRSSLWDLYQNPTNSRLIENWEAIDPITLSLMPVDKTGNFIPYTLLNNDIVFNYLDFHIAGGVELNRFNSIDFSFYHGGNTMDTQLLSGVDDLGILSRMYSATSSEWNTTMAQVSYNWLASPRSTVRIQSGFSLSDYNQNYSMISDADILAIENGLSDSKKLLMALAENSALAITQSDRNSINHLFFKTDFDYSFSPYHALRLGFNADRIESQFELNDIFYLETQNNQESWLLSTYVNNSIRFSKNWLLNAGSILTFAANRSEMYVEPRLSIQFDRANTSIGFWSMRLSGGLYRQFINQFDISTVGPSAALPVFTVWSHDNNFAIPKAYHGVLSFSLEPSKNTALHFETYLKYQPVNYITSYTNLMVEQGKERGGIQAFAEITDARNAGFSFRFEQRLINNSLALTGGYDYSFSSINMESRFGGRVMAPWNEPHRIQARALIRITDTFSAVGNWSTILGRSWGFRQSYYDFMRTHNVNNIGPFSFDTPTQDRLKNFHQMDVALMYQPSLSFAEVEVRLEINNLLNRQNEFDWNIQQATESNELVIIPRIYPGLTPNVSILVNF